MNQISTSYYDQKSRAYVPFSFDLDMIAAVKGFQLKNGKMRYYVELTDGTEVVVRAEATRRYDSAFFHADTVCTGKAGLASVTSFGVKSSSPESLRKTFRIQY